MASHSPSGELTPKHSQIAKVTGLGTPERRSRTPDPPRRTTTTLTSSLAIPVEGAVPIPRPSYGDKDPSVASNNQPTPSEPHPSSSSSSRAPRKSKSDAMTAIQAGSSSSAIPDDIFLREADIVHDPMTASAVVLPVSDILDLSTVKHKTDRNNLGLIKTRLFDLEECPTFYPSPEEFRDAVAYIQTICDIGKQYGICKIVPPEGWDMPFVTDSSKFRFKTRVQRLNQIEAAARAKLNFLEQLMQFHKQQGNSRMSIPTINHKPLDLWLLRREVQKLGGYDMVTKLRVWGDLGRRLGLTGIPGLSTQLKNTYNRVILPFEHYQERVRNSPALSPTAHRTQNPQLKTHHNIQTPTKTKLSNGSTIRADVESPPSSPASHLSSPLSDLSDDADGSAPRDARGRKNDHHGGDNKEKANGVQRAHTGGNNNESGKGTGMTGEICEICQKSNRGTEMLLCDGCDSGFHMFCLDPPLYHIPKGEWFCHTCLFGAGEDFGFDEGDEHSLTTFQARDTAFRELWFEKHPPAVSELESKEWKTKIGNRDVPESHVESEFWRLVQTPTETVEIEYGADVHSTTHGSAMPTLETHPDDIYSKDGWNLNNLPIAADSLLRYIKSDISGMTVPWTYVGMIFSTFCWHNEDHYTYSINYMHWGETKTWYGIPGTDAENFEAAMRQEAPDLFEAQPDLLFQLVTLMNPSRLRKSGVKVFACDQRAGEFVITFPKAYHAGFNHGFNFNEAVNFALPDWLPLGRECALRYQEHRKLPVFSLDELLVTITQYSQSIKTALWLEPSLREMVDRELSQRKAVRARYPNLVEQVEDKDCPEEQYQCNKCNAFCYLSQITCSCKPKVVCPEHADQLCDSNHSLSLRLRYSDADLKDVHAKVEERAALPSSWQQKLDKLLGESPKPLLRLLKAVLAEGERISYSLPGLSNLRKCVAKANEWVDGANAIVARKQHRKRNRKSKSTPAEEFSERPEKRLADVYRMLEEVETLGVDAPEIAALRIVVGQAESLRIKARNAFELFQHLEQRSQLISDCDSIISEGSSLNIYLDELVDLERAVSQHKLLQDISEVDDAAITLDDVRSLLSRARACDLPMDHPQISALQKRQDAGDDWEQKAARVLAQPHKTIEDLDTFDNTGSSIPVDPTVLDKLRAARMKALDFERQANAWLHPEKGAVLPKVQEVLRLVTRAETQFNIPAIRELKRTADFAADLESRCESVLKGRYQHREDAPMFETMHDWCRYAKEHLNKFQLPNFEKLDDQLEAHDRWMERLPWYCSQHKDAHGQQVFEDVMSSTKIDDDMPPSDEYFTCICEHPVRPPATGEVSDAVQCDHCFARFHGACARRGGSCPFCDHHHWNCSLRKERAYHYCYMPTILIGAPAITKNYSPAWKQLETIVSRVDRLCNLVGAFLNYASQPGNQRYDLLPQVRHYMRKLFRIGFVVAPNPDVSYGLDLAGLHRILASQPTNMRPRKRRRPKFVFGQDVDNDWTDGTRCICRGRTNYLLNYPRVQCDNCARFYHAACVFHEIRDASPSSSRFICPLCMIRKNRAYPNADVRVKYVEDRDQAIYVDVRACVEKFSKDLIRVKLPGPTVNTVFIDLIRFSPGSPEGYGVSNGTGYPPDSPGGGTYPAITVHPGNGPKTAHVPPPPPWPIGSFYSGVPIPASGSKAAKRSDSEIAGSASPPFPSPQQSLTSPASPNGATQAGRWESQQAQRNQQITSITGRKRPYPGSETSRHLPHGEPNGSGGGMSYYRHQLPPPNEMRNNHAYKPMSHPLPKTPQTSLVRNDKIPSYSQSSLDSSSSGAPPGPKRIKLFVKQGSDSGGTMG